MTDSGSVSLFAWTARPPSLKDALEAVRTCFVGGAVCLLYSPALCRLARYRDGKLIDEHDAEIEASSIFELRVFAGVGELRWWYDTSAGQSRAVYLTEGAGGPEAWQRTSNTGLKKLENRYLLWGRPDTQGSDPADWTRLTSERIGTLFAPIDALSATQRVCLLSCEYVGTAPGETGTHHGNRVIVAERLLGLETYDPPQRKVSEGDADE